MKRLTSKEKYFISCFVEKCNHLLQPSLGKTVSLYTFLDGTNESYAEQIKQIEIYDSFLAQILFDISNMVDDEIFYKRKMKELQKNGFSESAHFINTIRQVSEWLWLIESDEMRKRVRKDLASKYEAAQRENNSVAWPRSTHRSESRENGAATNIVSMKNEKVLKLESDRNQTPFNFDSVKQKIQDNILTSLQVLQILDQAASLGLTSDQIRFLEFEYSKAIKKLKERSETIYIVDDKGSVNFENRNLTSYSRVLESDGTKFNSSIHQNSYAHLSRHLSITKKPQKGTSSAADKVSKKISSSKKIFDSYFLCSMCSTSFKASSEKLKNCCPYCGSEVNHSSNELQNSEQTKNFKKIFNSYFFCSRCSTPFEAPSDKPRIWCPCCGGEVNRTDKEAQDKKKI
jgi:DNA-directed RNA polymerase subunit RPC12/RpoP